jgi:hypothetical protein
MRTFYLSLTAAAVALAGCDSADPTEEAFDGPTVEFGSTSVNASESDGTVEIPVTLSNGAAGQTYTVEVLYAAAASTAGFDDDIAGFGADAGANRVATVTLTGESDAQTVTVDVLEDEDIEGPEVAVFALQQASGGARIGDDREFRLEIGTPPIAQTRLRPDGDVVTVEGVVTGRFGRYTFLQDGTAGISVYAFSDTPFGSADIEPGDRVQIRGELSEFGARDGAGLGLKQIFVGRDSPAEFEVLSEGNDLPAPQTLTVAEILADGEAYESELIQVTGLSVVGTTDIVFQAGGSAGNYTVTDGTGETILRINSGAESELGGEPIPQGEFTFTGALGQFGGAYQLTPLRTTDLVEEED